MEEKLICKKKLGDMLSISRATVDRKRKSDPAFPKARKATDSEKGRCYFYLSEAQRYMQTLAVVDEPTRAAR